MVEAKLFALDDSAEPKEVELTAEIFGAPANPDLLYRAIRVQLLRKRQGTSSTKTRAERRGGGRKPWRQKGTGRARAGTRRSPLWVGGGTVFGPKPRAYNVRLTKKMRSGALASALSARAAAGKVSLLDRVEFQEPKTKAALSLMERLGLDGSTLVIVGTGEYNRPVKKSFSNLAAVRCSTSHGLNVYDVLRYENLVLTLAALEELKERF